MSGDHELNRAELWFPASYLQTERV